MEKGQDVRRDAGLCHDHTGEGIADQERRTFQSRRHALLDAPAFGSVVGGFCTAVTRSSGAFKKTICEKQNQPQPVRSTTAFAPSGLPVELILFAESLEIAFSVRIMSSVYSARCREAQRAADRRERASGYLFRCDIRSTDDIVGADRDQPAISHLTIRPAPTSFPKLVRATDASRSITSHAISEPGGPRNRLVSPLFLMGDTYDGIEESDSSSAAVDCAPYTIIRTVI